MPARHPDARELAKSIRDRVKYGLRYSDGSYETSPDMWEKRDARDIVVQTPEELDESGIGMCHDVTRALVKKLRENRIRHRAVMLKGDHAPNLPTHSFIVSKRDGKYDVLDPLSYDEGYRGGFDSFDDAVAGRIDDWRKEDEKGDVTTEPIRKRDWSRRPLLDFLRYGYEKKASARKKESYESGSGTVESVENDRTKDHDEIVIRLKDGRRIRISNNTRLGKRLGAKKGDRVNYNGYRVKGTDVVHKVHPNAHQRGGWLEAVPNRDYQIGKSAEDVQMPNEDFLKVSPARLKEKPAFKPSANGATLTPDLARANLYKEVYRQEKGDEYVPWEALDDARSDMETAQRRRYEELLKHRVLTKDDYDLFTDRFIPGMRLPQEEFVPGRNYPVYPSKFDEVPKNSFMSKGYGSIYDSYPIMSIDGGRSGMVYSPLSKDQSQNVSMNIGTDIADIGGPDVLHEGVHSFAHPSVNPSKGSSSHLGTSFWGKGGDFAPPAKGGSGYASGQAERLVAVATEKARMHARGVDVTKPGVGRAWAEQALKDRGVQQTDPDRVNFDYYMNVESLKSILYDLYDKANAPNATRADKIKYKQFLDTIDRDFQLVDNKGISNYTPYETKTASVFDGLEAAVDAAIDRITAN